MISFLRDLDRRTVRDALRVALQSAVAAALAYLGLHALNMPEKFLGILSAVVVVEPSVGTTRDNAWSRVSSTVVGCAIGALALLILPSGYGTAIALAFSTFVMNGVAALRPSWAYGVVATLALALGSEGQMWATALDRFLAISLGVAVGLVVSIVVWGERASTRAQRSLRLALGALSRYLQLTMDAVDGAAGDADFRQARGRYHTHINAARQQARAVRLADDAHLRDEIEAVDDLYHAVLVLERLSTETDDISDGDEDIQGVVRKVRSSCCAVVDRLANGDGDAGEEMEEIRDAIGWIREHLARVGTGTREHTLRNALAFGIDEIEDSLVRLRDTYADPGDADREGT